MIRRVAAALVGLIIVWATAACAGTEPPPREDGYSAGYSFMARSLAQDTDPALPASVCRQMFYRLQARGDDRAADTMRGCTDALNANIERRHAP